MAKFLLVNCHGMSAKQLAQMQALLAKYDYCIRDVKVVYRTAILNNVFPVCPFCNKVITSVQDFTVDHKMPRSHGGTDELSNLQPMQAVCNEKKGASLPSENTNGEECINITKCKVSNTHSARHRRNDDMTESAREVADKIQTYHNLRIRHANPYKKR